MKVRQPSAGIRWSARKVVVKIPVNATTISGKVIIGSTEWSAHSTGGHIPAGKKVKVVSSEGVHIVVEEVA